ncbi:zinc finger protein OZF-like [Mercenaria mercenaria]|uniref:zinc finger protein OZF-like n=1 Tax=Mercenaria mercenaria TaxID=6596 RepID=UPI00234F42E4|nr:zinc finger protein OZF-like [Mercenaria mercenaria]
MEVATTSYTTNNGIFKSFEDILETVKYEENGDSEDEIETVLTSDEEVEDESLCFNLESIFETETECKNENNVIRRCEYGVDIQPNVDDSIELETVITVNDEENGINESKRSKEFENKTDVSIHATLKYKCADCSRSYDRKSSLIRHLKRNPSGCKEKQSQQVENECGLCHKVFRDRRTLVQHMFIHTGERPYECIVCKKRFRQKSALKEHTISHHTSGDKRFKCTLCEKSYNKITLFNEHMQIHSGVRFQCTHCEKSFSVSRTLRNHMKLHETGLEYTRSHLCSICEKPFMTIENLKLHMEVHNGTQKQVCNICDARFSRKADLERHVFTHTGEKPYKCKLCPRTFRQPGELGRHMAWHRGDYTCKYCGRKYARKDELLRHVSKHERELNIETTSPNKLQCKYCEKVLTSEFNLQQHLETHKRKAEMYTCEECGITLSNNSNYHRHMRFTHNRRSDHEMQPHVSKSSESVDEGPFECDLCSKICKSKRTLTEHVNYVHLKKFKHVCSICDQNFYKRKDLKRHEERKHNVTLE